MLARTKVGALRPWHAVGALLGMAILLPALSWAAVVDPGAGLDEEGICFHPGGTVALGGPKFSVYTGPGLAGEGWTLVDTLDTGFNSGIDFAGIFRSAVWESDVNGNLLFAYQIANTGAGAAPRSIRVGNIVDYAAPVLGADCGVLHDNGSSDYASGDVLVLERYIGELSFAFEAQGTQHLLPPGDTSAWFYIETDVTAYTDGLATVQDSGKSAGEIAVLVPVPEPATLALLAAGAAGVVLRRRRRA